MPVSFLTFDCARYKRSRRLKQDHKFYSSKKNGIEHFVYFDKENLRRILDFSGFELMQEGLPISVKGDNSFFSVANRFIRKSMSLFDMDQEIFALARKC